MNVKQLVQENNQKRKLLTKENERYYNDLLVYLRLQLTLSEQQTEEILMEMLDHLIDGQNEGKTARDIFGDDPLAFTDEIIEHLPKEEKGNLLRFIGEVTLNLTGLIFLIRGIVLLVLAQFIDVNTEINLLKEASIAIVIGLFIILNTWYIFRLIKKALFNEKSSTKIDMFKAGIVSAASMAVVIILTKFLPEIGPSINISWWVSLIIGAILWLFHFFLKRSGS